QASTAYPGIAALVPTIGVALVAACGTRGALGMLSAAPLRWLGHVSYSLYLYHWPVIVLGTSVLGPLSLPERVALLALSLGLAAASRAAIEEPFLGRRVVFVGRRPLALAIGATALVLVTAQLVSVSAASSLEESAPVPTLALPDSDRRPFALPSLAPTEMPARSASPNPTPSATRAPGTSAADARRDTDALNERGCGLSLAGDRPPHCDLGDPSGTRTIALVGDSHAAQWSPALELIARARGWRLVPFTKDSCIFEDTRIVSIHLEREYTECERWRANVVDAVRRLHPDLVVVSSSRWVHPVDDRDSDPARQASDMARLVASLGAPAVVIADTPLMSQDVPACLSRRDATAAGCGTSRGYALTLHLARDARAAALLGAVLVDPTLWLCDEDSCPALIDDTVVYRDDHHLTATMARRLAPLLEPALLAVGAAVDAP
ncbi:MAG TPA: SGNH hydrolase domain-containing protein, partial [Candidatus Acidoferrales bacterium]|nr:SGNH hydrolase domain-containing protein [Candidatus Acidoferrales bacterium]